MTAVEYVSCSSLGGGEPSRRARSDCIVEASSSSRARTFPAAAREGSSGALDSSAWASEASASILPVTTEPWATTSSSATSARRLRSAGFLPHSCAPASRRCKAQTVIPGAASPSPSPRAIQPQDVLPESTVSAVVTAVVTVCVSVDRVGSSRVAVSEVLVPPTPVPMVDVRVLSAPLLVPPPQEASTKPVAAIRRRAGASFRSRPRPTPRAWPTHLSRAPSRSGDPSGGRVNRRAVELEDEEIPAEHGHGDVEDRHVADRALEAARVVWAGQDAVRPVLGDRDGKPVGAEERPDPARLAFERGRGRRVVEQDDPVVASLDRLEPRLERVHLLGRLGVDL